MQDARTPLIGFAGTDQTAWTYTEKGMDDNHYSQDAGDYQSDRPVSSEAECRECNGFLFQIGTFFACQHPECSRYAVPVNEYGNTDAEQEAEAEKQSDRQSEKYAERIMNGERT
jgi:hypothetical protein